MLPSPCAAQRNMLPSPLRGPVQHAPLFLVWPSATCSPLPCTAQYNTLPSACAAQRNTLPSPCLASATCSPLLVWPSATCSPLPCVAQHNVLPSPCAAQRNTLPSPLRGPAQHAPLSCLPLILFSLRDLANCQLSSPHDHAVNHTVQMDTVSSCLLMQMSPLGNSTGKTNTSFGDSFGI